MTNRKSTHPYRFNGHPYFDARSIHSVQIADLESWIKKFEAKLADPDDPDDRKWTTRWLNRFRRELEKKQIGRDLKQRDKRFRAKKSNASARDWAV